LASLLSGQSAFAGPARQLAFGNIGQLFCRYLSVDTFDRSDGDRASILPCQFFIACQDIKLGKNSRCLLRAFSIIINMCRGKITRVFNTHLIRTICLDWVFCTYNQFSLLIQRRTSHIIWGRKCCILCPGSSIEASRLRSTFLFLRAYIFMQFFVDEDGVQLIPCI